MRQGCVGHLAFAHDAAYKHQNRVERAYDVRNYVPMNIYGTVVQNGGQNDDEQKENIESPEKRESPNDSHFQCIHCAKLFVDIKEFLNHPCEKEIARK